MAFKYHNEIWTAIRSIDIPSHNSVSDFRFYSKQVETTVQRTCSAIIEREYRDFVNSHKNRDIEAFLNLSTGYLIKMTEKRIGGLIIPSNCKDFSYIQNKGYEWAKDVLDYSSLLLEDFESQFLSPVDFKSSTDVVLGDYQKASAASSPCQIAESHDGTKVFIEPLALYTEIVKNNQFVAFLLRIEQASTFSQLKECDEAFFDTIVDILESVLRVFSTPKKSISQHEVVLHNSLSKHLSSHIEVPARERRIIIGGESWLFKMIGSESDCNDSLQDLKMECVKEFLSDIYLLSKVISKLIVSTT